MGKPAADSKEKEDCKVVTRAVVEKKIATNNTFIALSVAIACLRAQSGTRTRTAISGQRILSPSCLPFHHLSRLRAQR